MSLYYLNWIIPKVNRQPNGGFSFLWDDCWSLPLRLPWSLLWTLLAPCPVPSPGSAFTSLLWWVAAAGGSQLPPSRKNRAPLLGGCCLQDVMCVRQGPGRAAEHNPAKGWGPVGGAPHVAEPPLGFRKSRVFACSLAVSSLRYRLLSQ